MGHSKNGQSDTMRAMENKKTHMLQKCALSATSACVSEFVTYPLDLTKTRLQIQGEISLYGATVSHSKRGMVKIIYGIVTEEGMLKLWQGVTPAIYRQIVYSGSKVNIYEQLRDKVFKKNSDGTYPLWKAVLSGSSSGAIAQLLASPNDLVKVRMQMEGRRRLEGQTPRVHGCFHAFRMILAESGIKGLWRGWVPNVQRAALVSIGDLVTYDTVKHFLMNHTSIPDNYLLHAVSSAHAGLVAALMCTPADVVKTRIMNQHIQDGRPVFYKGAFDCIMKTVRREGILAMYKGFFPTYCRLAPWTLVFWLVYEELRKATGQTSF